MTMTIKFSRLIRMTDRTHKSSFFSSSFSSSSSSSSQSSSSASFFLDSSAAFAAASSSSFFCIAASALLLTAKVSSAKALASSMLSVRMISSKRVPDLTCHSSNPMAVQGLQRWYTVSSSLKAGFAILGCSHSPLYAGLSISFCFHSPLYSGLLICGGSQSPSSSTSQSSGCSASGSAMVSGMSSYPSGLMSSGSGIFFSSTQSAGFDCAGSLISLGSKKSQSSNSEPLLTLLLSISTSYVLSGFTIKVYKCDFVSVSARGSFLVRRLSPL